MYCLLQPAQSIMISMTLPCMSTLQHGFAFDRHTALDVELALYQAQMLLLTLLLLLLLSQLVLLLLSQLLLLQLLDLLP